MQPNESKENNTVDQQAEFKPGTTIKQHLPPEKMTFDQLCECMNNFFNDREYEAKQGFKKGYSCVVGEDYTNIDLLCNLNTLIYNHCNDDSISKADKINFKNICDGIQSITKGLEQYNTSTQMDRVLISTLMGYILKITRNYFHDRH